KTSLKLAVARTKLLKNKNGLSLVVMKRELAQLRRCEPREFEALDEKDQRFVAFADKPSENCGKLPLPQVPGFVDDDDGDVNQEIIRQATTKKVLKDVKEQHRKALEEDPLVFDYDGAYDEIKQAVIRPVAHDRHERKDKYVTGAYKRKLAEQAKWLEEERFRELREKKDDVTKKSDMINFNFNLTKNVTLGAKTAKFSKPVKQDEEATTDISEKEVGQISAPERDPTRMEREMDQP
ncbi:hypothetical protein GIB67_028946, partial [Kingdonia uniflora]